jgi:hypothetical protein
MRDGLKRLHGNGQTAGPSTSLRFGRDDKSRVGVLTDSNCLGNTVPARLVIPTEAYPDLLLRCPKQSNVCAFP